MDFIGGHCTGDGNTFVGGTPSQFVTDDDIRVRVFSRWPAVVRQSLYFPREAAEDSLMGDTRRTIPSPRRWNCILHPVPQAVHSQVSMSARPPSQGILYILACSSLLLRRASGIYYLLGIYTLQKRAYKGKPRMFLHLRKFYLINHDATCLMLRVCASRWNAPDPVLYNASPYLGTMHGSDTYFLFDGECSESTIPLKNGY